MSLKQLILLFCIYTTISCENNNDCYTFESYPTLLSKGLLKSKHCFYNPVIFSDTPSIIVLEGFIPENHTFITEDGYILTLYRIVPKEGVSKSAQPIFLQHGILEDSSGFLFTRNDSLAINLALKGFDVWLGNSRSTTYARKNVNFTDSNPKFWEFSLDELAKYDVRGSLIKIAEITGKKGEIIYIGHSMGTTISFMYASSYPSDNLLKGIVSLSPVVYFDKKQLSLQLLFKLAPAIVKTLETFHIKALLTNTKLSHKLLYNICSLIPRLCIKIFIDSSLGQSDLFTAQYVTPYFTQWPDASSIYMLSQFAQMGAQNKFQKYDYGSKKNKEKYGQTTPPCYELKNIKSPVFLFGGSRDGLVKESSMIKLYNELGTDASNKDYKIVPINNTNPKEQFGHIEFFVGDRIKELFYPTLFRYLNLLKT